MNNLTRMLANIVLCCVLLAACAPQAPALTQASSAISPIPATMTQPAVSPTPLPVDELVTVPDCVEDGTGDSVIFNELLQSLTPTIYEMDSYRYHTLYRYVDGDRYADGELSVEVEGAHEGLLESPVESIFPLVSQSYERSKVAYTDLPSGARSETIVTPDGFWALGAGDTEWLAFDPATQADFTNLAEMFSPMGVLFMVGGGGSLAPGARADAPAMLAVENLDGRQVNHRCWILPKYEDSDFNAYLVHWESTYTFLSDAEVHLWTTQDDSQLVRLVLTGKHVEERGGLSEYAEEDEYTKHDPPRDFLLSMEITDVDTPVEIEPPASEQIALTIPAGVTQAESNPAADITAPYNELPVPAGAEKVGVFGGESEVFSPQRMTAAPREYRWQDYMIMYDSMLSEYLVREQPPADRRPVYEARISLPEAAAFYLDEMSRRGWQLKDHFYQLGLPVLYLIFERDGVTMPIVLEPKQAGVTTISAVLPPDEETLQLTRFSWTTYTPQNSDLCGDSIQAIAFDAQGRAWIGTSNGLCVFDGETWVTEKPGTSVNALAFDAQGRVWAGAGAALYLYEGGKWQFYHAPESITAMATDQSGRVWLGDGESGVNMFDGKAFTHYAPGEIGMPDAHRVDAIVADAQDRVFIGTNGGGVYMFDGAAWSTVREAKSKPGVINMSYSIFDLAFDPQGRLWVGAQEGPSVFDSQGWVTYPPDEASVPLLFSSSMAVDAQSRVWLGGSDGFLGLLGPDGAWSKYIPPKDAAISFMMNALAVDPQGRIWAGTDSGLNVFTPPAP